MEQKSEEVFKIGDIVRIINHKWLHLHPKKPEAKTIVAPISYKGRNYRNPVLEESNEDDEGKTCLYEYAITGLDYIGMTGVITGIDNTPKTEYEIHTGDIQKYIVRLTTPLSGWKNKRVDLFPSQIQKMNKTYQNVLDEKKEKEAEPEEGSEQVVQISLF